MHIIYKEVKNLLKRMSLKKIGLATLTLLVLFLMYLLPSNNHYNLKVNPIEQLEYTIANGRQTIFLLDSNGYIARLGMPLNTSKTIEKTAQTLLETLIVDGKNESLIPNGFRAILPSDTKIIGITNSDGILKVNFSKELLDISEKYEEKMIQAITYTLTSIKEITGVLIYVDDKPLTTLPKNKINLPTILTREYGINKYYDLNTTNNINKTTIYYISKYNDNYYYVPVTKYNNNSNDKIEVIIDELSSNFNYETNLMSFLNVEAKLVKYDLQDDNLNLYFNSYLFDDVSRKNVLEEVLYTISLSIGDNYKVSTVTFYVGEEQITKSVLKDIE